MTLQAGVKLGPYEIHSLIGSGGMGEVYRARDVRLERDVALKILPHVFSQDPQRLARLEREARILASLNHPNIAQIHGFEDSGPARALVMELVEGEDLAARIARGALPVSDVVPIAVQIAAALDAAHERGIVHRDLKPANVMVRPDGTVKVLDFGLARGTDGGGLAFSGAEAPQTSSAVSDPGLVLGTASYMSPEQARGEPVDKRTDIWAFGCLLYEMLTGTRLFRGKTVTEILASVLREEIDLRTLPAATPAGIRRVLGLCLIRNPRERLRDIGDALPDLAASDRPAVPAARHSMRHRALLLGALAAALALGVLAARALPRKDDGRTAPATRFELRLPEDYTLYVGLEAGVALSPDGRNIAIGAYSRDSAALLSQTLDEFRPHALSGTERGTAPFFSPDGEWVAFFSIDGRLMKVKAAGGQPAVICAARASRTGTWMADGNIIFDSPSGLMRVPADGGTPVPLTSVARDAGEIAHWTPRAIGNGGTILFTVFRRGTPQIAAVPPRGGRHRVVLDGTTPLGVIAGRLVHGRGTAIVATPFDPERLTGGGSPIVMAADVRQAGPRLVADLARNGTLSYEPAFSNDSSLVWVDRNGGVTRAFARRAAYDGPRLSPDDRRVAVTIADEEERTDAWVLDLERGTQVRLTTDGRSRNPIWLNADRILYTATRPGSEDDQRELLSISAGGDATAERVAAPARLLMADSVSADGKTFSLTQEPENTASELTRRRGTVSLLIDGRSPVSLLATSTDTRNGMISPNGRWVAYVSEPEGRPGVFLRGVDRADGPVPVSADMGWQPVWSRDGRELYFRWSNRIMRTTVDANGRVTPPAELFASPFTTFRGDDFFRSQYDVARDGRFLMVRSEAPGDQVRVVLNVHHGWGLAR